MTPTLRRGATFRARQAILISLALFVLTPLLLFATSRGAAASTCAAASDTDYTGAAQLVSADDPPLAFASPTRQPGLSLEAAGTSLLYSTSAPLSPEGVEAFTAALTNDDGNPRHPAIRVRPSEWAAAMGISGGLPASVDVLTYEVPIAAATITPLAGGGYESIPISFTQGASDSTVTKTVATLGGSVTAKVWEKPDVTIGVNGSYAWHNQTGTASTVTISQSTTLDPTSELTGTAAADAIAAGEPYVAVVTVTYDSAVNLVADPGRRIVYNPMMELPTTWVTFQVESNWEQTGGLSGAEYMMTGEHTPRAGLNLQFMPASDYAALLGKLSEHGVGINPGDFDDLQALFFEDAARPNLGAGFPAGPTNIITGAFYDAWADGQRSYDNGPAGPTIEQILSGLGPDLGYNLDDVDLEYRSNEWPMCDRVTDLLGCASMGVTAPTPADALGVCDQFFDGVASDFWPCVNWVAPDLSAAFGSQVCDDHFPRPVVDIGDLDSCVADATAEGVAWADAWDVCEILSLSGPGSSGSGSGGGGRPVGGDDGGFGGGSTGTGSTGTGSTGTGSTGGGSTSGGGGGGFTVTCTTESGFTFEFEAASIEEALAGCQEMV